MVEVLNGPDPVATAEANERGEWALVLEEPLPPGTHDLGIRTTSQDRSLVTLSDQRVAVSVPESAGEEPLVVLNQPDAPSQVIQLPADAETPAAPEVAVVPEPQQSEAMQEPPASSAETEMAAAPQPEPPAEITSSGDAEMAPPPADAASSDAPMETQGAETGVAAAPQSEPMMETPSSGESEMASASSEAESPAAPMETATETEVASAPEPEPVAESSMPSGAPEGAAVPPTMAPTTETVPEAPAQSGESSPIAETEVAAAPEPGSAPLDQAEMTASPTAPPADVGGETMTAAASDTAAPETTAAAAPERPKPPAAGGEMSNEAPVSSAAEPVGSPAPPEPQAEPPASVEAAPPATPEVGVAAVEAETNGTLYIAGTAITPEPVRVYVDDEFLGEATPTESGTWLLETTREMAPDEYTIRADQVEAGSGNVLARAEVPFEREIDVATLKPIGESASAGTAELSGGIAGPMQVIIKRGDNLWRISREMYGHGVRYSTIYQANRDQIRNPNLIYPGQVFVLPVGDTAWEPQQ
jgi:nucleoid-associated protein YgaU